MRALIIYHSADPDGWCSAALMHAIATEQLNGKKPEDVSIVSYNYDSFPKIYDDVDEVYMGDISPPPEKMQEIIDQVGLTSVFWCDHHMSRVKKIYDKVAVASSIRGLREDGIAGCKLIMDWMRTNREDLHGKYSKTNVVEFAHLYDTWKHEYRNDILELNAGVRSDDRFSPFSSDSKSTFLSAWKEIMSDEDSAMLKELRSIGKIAYQTQRAIWDRDCWHGKTILLNDDFAHKKVFLINTTNDPSLMFNQKIRDEHDCCIAWYFHQSKGKFKISCRSSDGKTAGLIAEKLGGGGHPDAAGAWINKMDWSNFKEMFEMKP